MASITSANAIVMITIPGVYSAPQQLQGFSTDEVFATDPLEVAEFMMGVDGVLSAGFVFTAIKQTFSLQADSPSNTVFDNWYQAELTAINKLPCSGLIILKGIGRKYTMPKGFLQMVPVLPDAAKTLRPRKFPIVWERMNYTVA